MIQIHFGIMKMEEQDELMHQDKSIAGKTSAYACRKGRRRNLPVHPQGKVLRKKEG